MAPPQDPPVTILNYHTKQLRLWAIQCAGGSQPWLADVDKAAEKFFAQDFSAADTAAYTGRTE